MHLSRSAVVLVGLVAIGTTQISDAKKTRVRNLFTRKNEGLDNDAAKDTAFLNEALTDEDEQYWDRILQQSASAPSVLVPTVATPTVPTVATPAPTPEETATCVQSGGTVQNAMCCRGVGDFPNTCVIGACGCSPFESQMVLTCVCPDGQCFNGNTCVVIPDQTDQPTVATDQPTVAPLVPTVSPPTVPPLVPTVPPPTVPPLVPTAPPPTNPPPTNPPPTNPAPVPTAPPPTTSDSSFSFIRRTRRQRRVKKRNDSDA